MKKFLALLFSLFCLSLEVRAADCTKVFLTTPDGVKIAINHYGTSQSEVLILAPGWFMTKDSAPFKQMASIFSKDMDVISMDFRGHGESSGFYTFGTKETSDLKTVVDWAREHYEKVYLIGFSLGGAISLVHCAEYGDIDKLVVVSAPSDFSKIENRVYKKEAWLPTLQKFEAKRWFSVRPDIIMHSKTKPIDIVEQVQAPTLFMAGAKDPTVYPWHTKELYEKAKCPKKYELFSEGKHAEDLFIEEKGRFVDACRKWLKE